MLRANLFIFDDDDDDDDDELIEFVRVVDRLYDL